MAVGVFPGTHPALWVPPSLKQSEVVVCFLAMPSTCWALSLDCVLWDVLTHGFCSPSRQALAETETLRSA